MATVLDQSWQDTLVTYIDPRPRLLASRLSSTRRSCAQANVASEVAVRFPRVYETRTTHPLVISTPRHVGSMIKYSFLRFGFLYHGTTSCFTSRVITGSDGSASRTGLRKRRRKRERLDWRAWWVLAILHGELNGAVRRGLAGTWRGRQRARMPYRLLLRRLGEKTIRKTCHGRGRVCKAMSKAPIPSTMSVVRWREREMTTER